MKKRNPDIFLEGDKVYLRKPNVESDVLNGDWHGWFNDQDITKYLVHGVTPISRKEEANIVESELENKRSLLLSIVSKSTDKQLGVISLKSIDLINRNAEIALVMGFETVPGAALEAMSLLTEHAFERMNLIKLYAGQHEDLWKWVNSLELIGYKIEGLRRDSGLRKEKYDTVLTGITLDDYNAIVKERGSLLTEDLFKKRRKENLFPEVKKFFKELYT